MSGFPNLQTGKGGIGGMSYPCFNAGSADLVGGSPMQWKYGLDYVGGVINPVKGTNATSALGLGEFAGILTRKIPSGGLGDIASSQLVVEGTVQASIYVDATPATYVVGAQLAPYYGSVAAKWGLVRVAYYTGITLMESMAAKTASTFYSSETGVGALVDINIHKRGASHYVWDGGLVADVDYFATATATSASVITEVETFLSTGGVPDFPRNVTVTPGGTTADVAAGDITVDGLDVYGNVIQELIAIAANASTIVSGTQAFASITKVTFPIQDGAAATYTIGTGPLLGLGRPYAYKPMVVQSKAAGAVDTAPTLAVDVDEVSKNTISFNTAPNSNVLETWIHAA